MPDGVELLCVNPVEQVASNAAITLGPGYGAS
jgi:hypothetical protein